MSLINKMLQDLDARQAAGTERIASNHVRPLPPATNSRPWLRLGAGAVAAFLLGAIGVLLFQPSRDVPPTAPSPAMKPGAIAPSAAVVSPTSPGPAPVSTPEAVLAPAAPPEATGGPRTGSASPVDMPLAAALESVGRTAAYGLKVATVLSVPPSLSARNDPRPATVRASSPAGNTPPPPMPIRQSDGPTRIEKSSRDMTAQERAATDYRQAVALLNEGRPGASMESLRAALRSDASLAEARLLLSALLLEKRQLEEARAVLLEGLATDPAQPRLAMPLARIQVELGDPSAAGETLSRAAQAAAGNAEYRGFYAAVLQRLGRHKEAAAEFQAALRLLPESGLWWMGLGISLEADGQRGAARDALRRARETKRLTPELDRYVEQKLQALS